MGEDEYLEKVMPLVEQAARHLCKKQNVAANGIVTFDDLVQELTLKAWLNREKFEPRLEAGEDQYVFAALRNTGRDALKKEREHTKAGTPESLETGRGPKKTFRSEDGAGEGHAPLARAGVSKNADPTPTKIQRKAASASERATQRARQEMFKTAFMALLKGTDREIFRLHSLSYNPQAIALETGLGVSTVYRRLEAIQERLRKLLD